MKNTEKLATEKYRTVGECPYNERVFDIIGRGVSRWGVEKVFVVDEENQGEKISVSIDNILLVNEEEE